MLRSTASAASKFSSMDKNHGPPGFKGKYSYEYEDLDVNEVLQKKGLTPADVRHPNQQAKVDQLSVA